MQGRSFKTWLAAMLLGFASLALADDLRRPYERIVVFGASISDPGNAFLKDGQNVAAPDYGMTFFSFLIPDYPYAVGGNRFSNGPTWIEQLAGPIGLGWSVRPAFVQSTEGSANYAVGGSRAREGVPGEVSLSEQVTRFLSDSGPSAPSRALYVIEIGGNDIRDALLLQDPAVLGEALFFVDQAIRRLHAAGARKFLVWNVPNLARTPGIRAFDEVHPADIGAGALALTVGYNDGLKATLDALQMLPPPYGLPGIHIVQFNAFEKLESIAEHPRRYLLRDASTACIRPFTALPSRCEEPHRFFFWDGIHPTRAGHGIIAIEAAKTLIGDALADH